MKHPELLTAELNMDTITDGNRSANLDNANICATTSVQADREFTTNGCHVKVFFKKDHNPEIKKEIARLLLTAFEQEGHVDEETSSLSVQSVNEKTA